ncbi:hypothetical protein [Bradyrhizobium genosp. A]|uniref:hypothetical protein n=1 Tax=Bradyrhizobium genosp. A TaxID=83626 RepID=UPI003CEA6C13
MTEVKISPLLEEEAAKHRAKDAFHHIDRPLAPDFLRTASGIAMFVYGRDDKPAIRSIHHLTEHTAFPSFKFGGLTCALKSTIRAHIWNQQVRRAEWWEPEESLMRLHILLTSILHLATSRSSASQTYDPAQALLAEAAETIQRVLHPEAR